MELKLANIYSDCYLRVLCTRLVLVCKRGFLTNLVILVILDGFKHCPTVPVQYMIEIYSLMYSVYCTHCMKKEYLNVQLDHDSRDKNLAFLAVKTEKISHF